jgi:hypothetical protein
MTPTTDVPAADSAATFAPAFIEAPTRYRLVTCPTCAAVFAVPMDVYLQRLADPKKRGVVHCFDGHPVPLVNTIVEKTDALAAAAAMVVELRQARYDADRLRAILATVPRLPSKPPTPAEIERRIRHVVNRARNTDFGKVVCRFCELASRTASSLKAHVKAVHLKEITEGGPEEFAP